MPDERLGRAVLRPEAGPVERWGRMRYAATGELTGRGIAHDYQILLPSGNRLRQRGILSVILIAGDKLPAIRHGRRLFVLDPRSVISRDGLIIYHPRRKPVPAWAQTWLDAHPEWPLVATEALAP